MKKTITVLVDREPIFSALMKEIGFTEIERVATGGMTSIETLIITYEGLGADYREDFYLKIPHINPGREGYYTNDVKIFKNIHDKSGNNNFEICRF